MRNRRNLETIAGRIASDGTISMCSDLDVVSRRIQTGVFSVTFPNNFRLISATANAIAAAAYAVNIGSMTPNSVGFGPYVANTGVGLDTPIAFTAVGYRV
jgi:hypothetical protein